MTGQKNDYLVLRAFLACATALLCVSLILILMVASSCRAGGVNISPHVEYERRMENNDGEGVRLGVTFSPAPEPRQYQRRARVGEHMDDRSFIDRWSVDPRSIASVGEEPIVCSVCLAAAASALESNITPENPDENQDITIETPLGPFTIAGGSGALLMLLVLLGLQKKGMIPTPTPKE